MTKLKYYIKGSKKIYTLKEQVDNVKTQDAHYKFLKLRDVKERV